MIHLRPDRQHDQPKHDQPNVQQDRSSRRVEKTPRNTKYSLDTLWRGSPLGRDSAAATRGTLQKLALAAGISAGVMAMSLHDDMAIAGKPRPTIKGDTNNICSVSQHNLDLYRDFRDTGYPVEILGAIIRTESNYDENARTPLKTLKDIKKPSIGIKWLIALGLGDLPTGDLRLYPKYPFVGFKKITSAGGPPQATDGTWARHGPANGSRWDMADSIKFMRNNFDAKLRVLRTLKRASRSNIGALRNAMIRGFGEAEAGKFSNAHLETLTKALLRLDLSGRDPKVLYSGHYNGLSGQVRILAGVRRPSANYRKALAVVRRHSTRYGSQLKTCTANLNRLSEQNWLERSLAAIFVD